MMTRARPHSDELPGRKAPSLTLGGSLILYREPSSLIGQGPTVLQASDLTSRRLLYRCLALTTNRTNHRLTPSLSALTLTCGLFVNRSSDCAFLRLSTQAISGRGIRR
ncbi:hypothetical protein J6590_014076 [Homalodisca vitripennis]|nr:hypothetical protein J6590_014076 [Homalodisca vitripennis]